MGVLFENLINNLYLVERINERDLATEPIHGYHHISARTIVAIVIRRTLNPNAEFHRLTLV